MKTKDLIVESGKISVARSFKHLSQPEMWLAEPLRGHIDVSGMKAIDSSGRDAVFLTLVKLIVLTNRVLNADGLFEVVPCLSHTVVVH